MANGYPDTTQQPMFSPGIGQGMQGMFGGLRRGFSAGNRALHPYSNRLLLAGMGLLSGRDGMANAMKGMIAGSALDTEDADRRKLNEAIQGLMDDTSGTGLLAKASPAERAYLLASPPTLSKVMADQMSPPSAGVSINMGDYKVPPKYRYKDPNNPDAGVELIPGVATDRSESEQKGDVLLATVEPDYQTALTTYGALSDPVGLAASYGGNLGRYFQSGEFQSGSDAITSVAQSYIYAISGAQAPEQEVRRIAQLVMPAMNDKPQALELKKKRLGAMVQAIRAKTGAPPLVSPDDPLGLR